MLWGTEAFRSRGFIPLKLRVVMIQTAGEPTVCLWHVPVFWEEMCMDVYTYVPASACRCVHIVKHAGIEAEQCSWEVSILRKDLEEN